MNVINPAVELPQGFAYYSNWINGTRFRGVPLVDMLTSASGPNRLAWEQRTIKIFGRMSDVPRLTCWMGEAAYKYSGIAHKPAPMPPSIQVLRGLVEISSGSTVRYNSVLANMYRDGAHSVAWHSDDEPELGGEPTIASLSLGASRRFSIKRVADGQRWDLVLNHGDLLVMSGRSQADYVHAVPKTTAKVGPRINLTFRTVIG